MGWDVPCTVIQGIKGNILRESVNFKIDIADHPVLTCLRAHLIAKLASVDGSFCLPKCHLEVWAEDGRRHPKDRELAYCRGFFSTDSTSAAFIEWLGRSRGRPAHECVRGLRCVPQLPETVQRTVPQALIGVFAALAQRCGAAALELEPQDEGSGKLMQYYFNLWFEEVPTPGKTKTMRAQTQALERLAPAVWVEQLVPPGFDMREWFNVRARITHLPCSNYLRELAVSARRFEQCEVQRIARTPGPRSQLDAVATRPPPLLPGAVPDEQLAASEPNGEVVSPHCCEILPDGPPSRSGFSAGIQRNCAEHLPEKLSSRSGVLRNSTEDQPDRQPSRSGVSRKIPETFCDKSPSRSGSKASVLPALGASGDSKVPSMPAQSERILPQLQTPSRARRCRGSRQRSLLGGLELVGNATNLRGLENALEMLKSRLRRVD